MRRQVSNEVGADRCETLNLLAVRMTIISLLLVAFTIGRQISG